MGLFHGKSRNLRPGQHTRCNPFKERGPSQASVLWARSMEMAYVYADKGRAFQQWQVRWKGRNAPARKTDYQMTAFLSE